MESEEVRARRSALEAVVSISMDSLAADAAAAKKAADDDIDVQLQADWEDIGGVGHTMTQDELEHIATTMFGCPEVEPEGKTLMQVFGEAGMLDDEE